MELEDNLCYKCKKFNLNGGACDSRDYLSIVGFIDECEEFEKFEGETNE